MSRLKRKLMSKDRANAIRRAASTNRSALRASATPATLVEQHASLFLAGAPVLHAPCGFGRNTLYLAKRGCKVIGVDIDNGRISFVAARAKSDPCVEPNISLAVCDLNAPSLPFGNTSLEGLIMINFIPKEWNPYFAVLQAGGHLIFETMGGQGGNYLELPCAGQIEALLEPAFCISSYRERPVGPPELNAVTVKLVAMKR
jgi:SAM-dependent methyltransferase